VEGSDEQARAKGVGRTTTEGDDMTRETYIEPRTPQETALIAIRVGRAAELQQQMDLILLRSMARQAEEEQA
jgi:hypothetical protein